MARKEKKTYQTGDYRGWMVPAWGSRAASLAVNVVFLTNLNFYLVDALGLAPAAAGIILALSQIFDGVTDLFAGLLVDKTHTRLGKARPYEFCILAVWICTILLFSTPDFGTIAKYIWVFIFYSLVNSVFATLLNATDAVYLGRALKNGVDQAKLMSINGVIVIVFCTAFSILFPQLVAAYGSRPGGWTTISLIVGVPLAIIGMGRFFFIREMDMGESDNAHTKVTVKTILLVLKENKYIFLVAIATLLYQFSQGFINGTNLFYFQYVYGNVGAASTVGIVGMITPFLFLVIPVLMKKYSLAQITIAGFVMAIAGNVLKFAGGPHMGTLIGGSLLAGLGVMPLSMLISIFLIECMDFGEWKTGIRLEGAYGSVRGLADKIGTALSTSVLGFILQAAGFNKELAVQSGGATFAINALYSLIPAALLAVALLVISRYDLYKKLPEIRAELDSRRAGSVQE